MDQLPELTTNIQAPTNPVSDPNSRISSAAGLSEAHLVIKPFISPQEQNGEITPEKKSLNRLPLNEPIQLFSLENSDQAPSPSNVLLPQMPSIEPSVFKIPAMNSYFHSDIGISEDKQGINRDKLAEIGLKTIEESPNNIIRSLGKGSFAPSPVRDYERSFQNFSGTMSWVELNTSDLKKARKLTPPPIMTPEQKGEGEESKKKQRSALKSNKDSNKNNQTNSINQLSVENSVRKTTRRDQTNQSGSSNEEKAREEPPAEVAIDINPPNADAEQPNQASPDAQNLNNANQPSNPDNVSNSPHPQRLNIGDVVNIDVDDNGLNLLEVLAAENNGQPNNAIAPVNTEIGTENIIRSETWVRVRITFVLLACALASATLLRSVILEGASYQGVFVAIYFFLAHAALERAIRLRKPSQHRWQFREGIFRILDCVGVILLALLINLKLEGKIKSCNDIFLYELGCTILYLIFSEAPRYVKEGQTVVRLVLTVQMFLLTGKIDGNVNWPWLWILIAVIIYLGVLILYILLLLVTIILMSFLAILGVNGRPGMNMSTQYIGILWNFFVSSLSLLGLLCIIEANVSGGQGVLLNCLRAVQVLCAFLLVYTVLFNAKLIEYLVKFAIEMTRSNSRTINSQGPKMTVQLEKAKSYFVMLTPTYFVQLKDSFVIKDKEKLQKIKQNFNEIKETRFRTQVSLHVRKMFKNIKKITKASLLTLKKDKEVLDFKFARIEAHMQTIACKKNIRRNSTMFASPNLYNDLIITSNGRIPQESDKILDKQDEKQIDSKKERQKVWLSEGDISDRLGLDKDNDQEDENNGTCYICCTKKANAVIMDCGHGGVCYECATEFLVKKGQCMECRRKVTNVVKVNTEFKMKNIAIGYELGVLKKA